MMKALIEELIPHAPHAGLYVAPHIPEARLRNAIRDFGEGLVPGDVVALYDATLLGTAKDGVLFTADGIVFQNNDLEPIHRVRYADLVRVEEARRLLGGRKVELDVNRGRATFTVTIDFSAHKEAAGFAARFLKEAMLRGAAHEMDRVPASGRTGREGTDPAAVRRALEPLLREGTLSQHDFEQIMELLS